MIVNAKNPASKVGIWIIHKIEVVLTEDVAITLRGLPFHSREAVKVIILQAKT